MFKNSFLWALWARQTCAATPVLTSPHPRMPTTVELLACNGLPREARLFWVNGDDEVDYGVVESGSTRVQSTFKEQRWRLRCEKPSAEVECTTSDEAEQHLLLTEASCRQKPTTRPAPQRWPLMSHHLTHPPFRRRLESRLAEAPAPASCLSESPVASAGGSVA